METKPGKQSTEFWALIGIGVLILANGSQWIDIPWEQIQWYGGIAATYIAGRSWVKTKASPTVAAPSNGERKTPQP